MQQIVRRLRAAPRFVPGERGTLPTYLLFGPALGLDPRAHDPVPEPAAHRGRRRSSVLIFLEKVLWPS